MERFPTEDGETLHTERGDTGPEIMGWEGLKKQLKLGHLAEPPLTPPIPQPKLPVTWFGNVF